MSLSEGNVTRKTGSLASSVECGTRNAHIVTLYGQRQVAGEGGREGGREEKGREGGGPCYNL